MRDHGQLLAARAQFRSCAQPVCPSVVVKSCTEWLIELDQRIPSIVLRVRGHAAQDLPHANVLVDDVVVPLDGRPIELDPGAHDISANAPGWLGNAHKVLLADGEQRRLVLLELRRESPQVSSEPAAAAPPPRSAPTPRDTTSFRVPMGSWILGGVGVVGIAGFAVLRAEAAGELSRLRATCAPDCMPSLTEPGRHYATAADVSLAVGAVALAGAATWTLIRWLDREPSAPTLVIVPSRGGMSASLALRY
jgi:hypothetical protein